MLKHPYFFLLSNILITSIFLLIGGFKSSYYVILIVSFIILLSNVKYIGLMNSLSLVIVYMLIFDSDFFSLTSLNIRIWYFIEFPLLCYYFLRNLNLFKQKYNKYYISFIAVLLLILLFYLIIDPFDGKLSIFKYVFFSIGLIYVLYCSFLDILKIISVKDLFTYFYSLGVFVALWGIMQFITVFSPSIHQKIMFDYNNVRPSAFFSETTWYSEYIFFTIVILYYLYFKDKKKSYLFCIIPCLLGVFISNTRNTFLAIGIWFFLGILFALKLRKINKKLIMFYIILFIFILFVVYTIGIENITFITKIIARFTKGDSGRLDALKLSISRIMESPILGLGFTFNPKTDVAGLGTFIGAKSFNFFLMIIHTIGFEGFVIFIFLLFSLYTKLIKQFIMYKLIEIKIAIVFISSFLSISMFAPMHQFPIGMFFVSIALTLSKYVDLANHGLLLPVKFSKFSNKKD